MMATALEPRARRRAGEACHAGAAARRRLRHAAGDLDRAGLAAAVALPRHPAHHGRAEPLPSALRQGGTAQRRRHRRHRSLHLVHHRARRLWRRRAGAGSGGIYFVECFGAYAMGRRYIRNVARFPGAVACSWRSSCAACSPWRCPNWSRTQHFLREAFRACSAGPALPVIEPRLGLARAFGSFEHPILFGVFCSMAFATAWFVGAAHALAVAGWLLIGAS